MGYSLMKKDSAKIAREALESLGLPAEPLSGASGWSSGVWLGPAHAVRISSGRFEHAYTHEFAVLGMLPDSVPHAEPIARTCVDGTECLIVSRVTGCPMIESWNQSSAADRREAIESLGNILRILHQVPLPGGFTNPTLDEALAPGGHVRDAYHAPPDRYAALLDAGRNRPGVVVATLDNLELFIRQRLPAFEGDSAVLVHTDIHFANIMSDGPKITALLDFEGARPAAPDQELDTLLRFVREPELFLLPEHGWPLSAKDLAEIPEWLRGIYPELFSHPRLKERLETYEAMWQLVQLLNFPPNAQPADPLGHIRKLLETDNRWAEI